METIDPTQSMPASDSSQEIALDLGPVYFRRLSGEEAARVDEICDVFETKLVTGQQPRIEDYLGGFKGNVRSALVCELLILELEHLKSAGKVPDHIAYRNRLPEDVRVVDRVFDHLFPRPAAVKTDAEETEIRIPEYQLQRKLGSGGMGTVYKAIQLSLERDVAIKVLREDRVSDVESRLRFMQEMKVVGQLKHPNIVEAYDAGHPSGVYYLAMEYIDGLDLAAVVRRRGPLPVADACEVARRAAMGLQKAHRLNLVHRDIKPSNLLLGRASSHDDYVELKIADLGLARLGAVAAKQEESEQRHVMGTFDFMAPEQFFNPDEVDVRADIYSLGCTMYSLLLGKAPFSGRKFNNAVQKMKAHRSNPPPMLRHVRPDVPEELEAMIQKMAAKTPEQRFQTPEDLAEALAPFCDGHDLTELLHSAEESEERPESTKQIMISPTVSQVDMESPTAKIVRPESDPPVQNESTAAVSTNPAGVEEPKAETLPEKEPASRKKAFAVAGILLGVIALAAIALILLRPGDGPPIPSKASKTIDLLARVEAAQDSVGGDWLREDGTLVSPAAPDTWLLLRADPPEQYKLEIKLSENRSLAFAVGIVRNGEPIPVVHRKVRAVAIDDSPQTSGDKKALAKKLGFVTGSKETYTCIVRKEGFVVAFEDMIITARRKGELYAIDTSWLPPRWKGLFLATRSGPVRITAIRMTPLP